MFLKMSMYFIFAALLFSLAPTPITYMPDTRDNEIERLHASGPSACAGRGGGRVDGGEDRGTGRVSVSEEIIPSTKGAALRVAVAK